MSLTIRESRALRRVLTQHDPRPSPLKLISMVLLIVGLVGMGVAVLSAYAWWFV